MFCGRPLSIAPWRAGKTTLPHSAKCHWHSLLRSVRRPPCLPLSGSDTRKQMITNRTPPAHSLPLSAYMRTGARQTFDSSPSPSLSLPLHVVLQAMATRPPPSPRSPSPRRPRSESLESPSSPVQLYPERRRSVRKGGAKDGRTREGRESRRCKRRPSNDSRRALTRVSVSFSATKSAEGPDIGECCP